jgi:putative addiction module killer protein
MAIRQVYRMQHNAEGFQVHQTAAFVAWLESLRDPVAQGRIAARIRRLQFGHLGDWKPIDGQIGELRIHCGPGYRVYFVRRGRSIIVLLAGGHKLSQPRDIVAARAALAGIGDLR